MAGVELETRILFAVHYDDRPLLVRGRDSLGEHPETAVVLGLAPDGLPLVLRVGRRASVEGAVLAALGYVPRDRLSPAVARALAGLEEAVQAEARRVGVERCEAGELYRSRQTIGQLFGPTLLARMLGAHSPLTLAEDRHLDGGAPEQVANTAAVALSPGPITVMKELDTSRYLAVPLRPGVPLVAEIARGDEAIAAEGLAPLRFEDLRGLDGARFVFEEGSREGEGELADADGYLRAVRRAERLGWRVGRQAIGRALVDLARGLQAFHDERRAHCDVKPANTLITSDRVVAIDPLGVRFGQVSPGATPGWAAPEQILARPVSAQTDVFALGLLAARLVGAAIHGEEKSFVIPTGGEGRRRVRLLGEPEVFLDRGATPLDGELCRGWQDLIRRAVAFDPERRPASAAAFALELEALLARGPLPGEVALAGGPGQLSRSVEVLGALQPSWVVSDLR
jgi:hypothetical protein